MKGNLITAVFKDFFDELSHVPSTNKGMIAVEIDNIPAKVLLTVISIK